MLQLLEGYDGTVVFMNWFNLSFSCNSDITSVLLEALAGVSRLPANFLVPIIDLGSEDVWLPALTQVGEFHAVDPVQPGNTVVLEEEEGQDTVVVVHQLNAHLAEPFDLSTVSWSCLIGGGKAKLQSISLTSYGCFKESLRKETLCGLWIAECKDLKGCLSFVGD